MDPLKQSNSSKLKNTKRQHAKLLATLKKKKECEKKALNIVIELIDGGLEEDVFLNKVHLINACHYEDVVEERFIMKQCGYAMCNQRLTNVPAQQFKISLDKNKVYDITERKKFCSNMCYKSSKYLQNQLLTSPLWLRDVEIIPEFKLLKTELKQSPKEKFNPVEIKLNNQNKEGKNSCVDQLEEKISEFKI